MNYESLLSNLWYGLVILTSVTKLLKTEMNYISLKHLLFILSYRRGIAAQPLFTGYCDHEGRM